MQCQVKISIHALLAESDPSLYQLYDTYAISIHALLAESDSSVSASASGSTISIHALLAESDRCVKRFHAADISDFYPRSPCGERLKTPCVKLSIDVFLSTLSLRRATSTARRPKRPKHHFYPRSPCGERHQNIANGERQKNISIHALLAESDEKENQH